MNKKWTKYAADKGHVQVDLSISFSSLISTPLQRTISNSAPILDNL